MRKYNVCPAMKAALLALAAPAAGAFVVPLPLALPPLPSLTRPSASSGNPVHSPEGTEDALPRSIFARVANRRTDSTPGRRPRNGNAAAKSPRRARAPLLAGLALLARLVSRPVVAWASGGMASAPRPDAPPLTSRELASKLTLWLGVFLALALLHAAEIAITTLYPWKVREFAEEEEKQRGSSGGGGAGGGGGSRRRGTFQTLDDDISRVLTTILVASTASSIYATTLFTALSHHILGPRADRWSAVFLTAITLFFVELLPKNVGVISAERVARVTVPPINVLANVVGPVGAGLSSLAKGTLSLFGLRKRGDTGVSDSELRLIVTGARDSGTIDHSEQEMIKGVLNLQDQKVSDLAPWRDTFSVRRSLVRLTSPGALSLRCARS